MKPVIQVFFKLMVLFAMLALLAQPAFATIVAPRAVRLANPNYSYYLTGSPNDSKAKSTTGFALVGGGEPIIAVFKWLIEKANHGDVVVLRATEDDIYNKLFWSAGSMDSVETVVVKTRAGADEAFVLQKVKDAEVVFIAGGNQWNYVSMWQGTKLAELLRKRISAGLTVGGTSAGLAILGEYYFSAKNGTVESEEALKNPFNEKMTINNKLLNIPFLINTITDSHFSARDRLGRLVAFMGVISEMSVGKGGPFKPVHGVGVDEDAALLIESSNGIGRLVGQGNAYLLSGLAPEVCEMGKPLTYKTIVGYQMTSSSLFNFKSWTGLNGKGFRIEVDKGELTYH